MADPFQTEVQTTVAGIFGEDSATNPVHRASRFIEEALELVQAQGMSRERAKRILYYVYDRPAGEPEQEVGGVAVTLAALCNAMDIDMVGAAYKEHTRLKKNGPAIARKNLTKPKSLDEEPVGKPMSNSFDPKRNDERRKANDGVLSPGSKV